MNWDILFVAGSIFVGLLVLGMILARLYKRASKQTSFVRTGFRGETVIMNGGALVLPVLHEIIEVNMNTLRLEVARSTQEALITRDRMRVDVKAEFYVRVQPSRESIAAAAQTLGRRTMNPEELRDLIEGKFIDALRSVAAEMAMMELHEKRSDFVQKVQQVLAEELLKNGLELESVSLTSLNQTSREFFNADNAFDAEGLTRLTQEIEARRKLRNDVEQDTAVQIQQKNLDAQRQRLELERQEQFLKLDQQREIAVRTATQQMEVAREQAEKDREAQEARILADQKVAAARLQSERAVEEERVSKERTVQTVTIEKERAVAITQQEREIAIANKSKEQSEAKEQADRALAKAVQAEEQVITARQQEVAERDKKIEIVQAEKQAEMQAISVKVSAKAEKDAAIDRAEAMKIEAQGKADAVVLEADAEARRYEVKAKGELALNEAANVLSSGQIDMRTKLELIGKLAEIIRESVKPIEKIDGIKIIQVDGLGAGNGAAGAGSASNGNLADAVVNSALRYRAQAPLLDSLLSEIGISGGDLGRFSKGTVESLLNGASVANGHAPAEPAKPAIEPSNGGAVAAPPYSISTTQTKS
jgi:uncharacterized membrane protein YqiK